MAWFAALSLLEKIFFYIAAPSTVILLLQTLFLFVGGDGDDSGALLESDTSGIDFDTADLDVGGLDLDLNADVDFDFDAADSAELATADLDDVQSDSSGAASDSSGLRFFTIRGVVAFLTVSGWTGICTMELGGSGALAIFLALQFGTAAMVGIAYLVRAMMRLQSSGTIEYRKALGLMGDVYLPIPAGGSGMGKVSLSLGGGLKEYDAVTPESEPLKTGELVRVTDIIRDNIMVVEREKEQ